MMPKKGYKQTKEHKRKLSLSAKGKHYYWLGKKHSKKHRRKVAQAGIGRHPSEKTRLKLSQANKGKKNHNWKGGIRTENRRIRNSVHFRLWREAVFARDNYTCQSCGAINGNGKEIYLEPHHLKSFAEYPELRFAIDNGQTLCRDCHKLTDNYKGHTRPAIIESIMAK